jgi:hypothetical protein
MHSEAQTIARLKSMVFLIEEALRIADEGDDALLGAKLSDCIDCVYGALAEIDSRPRGSALASDDSAAVNSATISI